MIYKNHEFIISIIMKKSKQIKSKIKLSILPVTNHNKKVTPQINQIHNANRILLKKKKQDLIKQIKMENTTIMKIIRQQMSFSQQQHHQYIKKQSLSKLKQPIKKKTKQKVKQPKQESVDNQESIMLYLTPQIQQIKRSRLINLCRKQIKPQRSEIKFINFRKSRESKNKRQTFNIKSTIANQQIIAQFKLKQKAFSLPKLSKLPQNREEDTKGLDDEFAPWELKDSKQYFVKIKQENY